jgi:acyl-CoA synthetase (AMP-forming)/AMP-acid ligase II
MEDISSAVSSMRPTSGHSDSPSVDGSYVFNPPNNEPDRPRLEPLDIYDGLILATADIDNDFRYYEPPSPYSDSLYAPQTPHPLDTSPPPLSAPVLEPREFPFPIMDPHDAKKPMSGFSDIATILRERGLRQAKNQAFIIIDAKGKEVGNVTWDKLASRAEKVAQVIRDKSGLYRGDRVALVYRDSEIIEFTVALFGCFIAGVTAVPINHQDDYQELNFILNSTQAHLALTTDYNLKAFQRDLAIQKLAWPRGVEWWKTNEFGAFHAKRKGEETFVAADLAYIEFSRSPTAELRGVVISHMTIMHQMACLAAIIASSPKKEEDRRDAGEILLTYLDCRMGVGMIFAALGGVYGGFTTIWSSQGAVTVPGLWANLITRYKGSCIFHADDSDAIARRLPRSQDCGIQLPI